jgi:hypothetical protein
MKPGHVKVVVLVVAVTAVEGADVRAEGEAVTGVVVAEDATRCSCLLHQAQQFQSVSRYSREACRS